MIKIKSIVITLQSDSNFEFHCLKGLSGSGKVWAKQMIQQYKSSGFDIPFGIIRTEALKMK